MAEALILEFAGLNDADYGRSTQPRHRHGDRQGGLAAGLLSHAAARVRWRVGGGRGVASRADQAAFMESRLGAAWGRRA